MAVDAMQRISRGITITPTGCWEWGGSTTPGGYGLISVGGKRDYTHRVVYRAMVGAIPDNYDIDHICRNRSCCCPSHLDAVTRKENLLRGFGWAGINARKTHCKRGHAFTPDNTRMDGRGRQCRKCDQIRKLRRSTK